MWGLVPHDHTAMSAVTYTSPPASFLFYSCVPDPGVVQYSGPMWGDLKGVTKFHLSLKKSFLSRCFEMLPLETQA